MHAESVLLAGKFKNPCLPNMYVNVHVCHHMIVGINYHFTYFRALPVFDCSWFTCTNCLCILLMAPLVVGLSQLSPKPSPLFYSQIPNGVAYYSHKTSLLFSTHTHAHTHTLHSLPIGSGAWCW